MENTISSAGETRERSAQVCDGCRKRKVKCDGKLPACSNCARLQSTCTFSAQLQRKTKRRGHTDPKDEIIQRLQNEVAELRRQLQSSSSIVPSKSQHALSLALPSQVLSQTANPLTTASLRHHIHRSSSGPITRHLGRLVSADDGVDQFAGTTTGVHFTLTAQQKYQELFHSTENFPEVVFSLHLLPVAGSGGEDLTSANRSHGGNYRKDWFLMPKRHYKNRIDTFLERWAPIYPIVPQKQFVSSMDLILSKIFDEEFIDDKIALYQLFLVLAITGTPEDGHKNAEFYFGCSSRLQNFVTSMGDLASLQSLLLQLIFLQQSRRHHLVVQTIGSIVRLAQSLGLHRHARRFKFCVGETEVRKRIWWSVYAFDVMISLQYGLPKIIQDEDDDNDLPVDCDFDDITVTQLPLPLPGENTIFSSFLCYVRLSKILSTTLKELYTTTRRRNAVDKMATLDRELRMWLSFSEPVIGELWDPAERQDDVPGREFPSLWLHILYRLAMIFIHRPALTFEPTEPKFKDSLGICSEAASAAIQLFLSSSSEAQLFQLLPIGPSIVFQCGLLNLFAIWYLQLPPCSFETSIESAATLLQHLEAIMSYGLSGLKSRGPERGSNHSLSHAAWVLRHLFTRTSQLHTLVATSPASSASWAQSPNYSASAPMGDDSHLELQIGHAANVQVPPQGYQQRSGLLDHNFSFGNGGGIDYLNQMDDSMWNFLPSVDEMMGDVSLDFNAFH